MDISDLKHYAEDLVYAAAFDVSLVDVGETFPLLTEEECRMVYDLIIDHLVLKAYWE